MARTSMTLNDEEMQKLVDAGIIVQAKRPSHLPDDERYERYFTYAEESPRFIKCDCGRWYETDHGDWSLYHCPVCDCNYIGGTTPESTVIAALNGKATNVPPKVYYTRDWSKGIGEDIREVRADE